jgi:hypothetical protein
MAGPEAPNLTEQFGSVLEDPFYFILKFRDIEDGKMSKEQYIDWVKKQGEDVKAEEERRRLNPQMAGIERNVPFGHHPKPRVVRERSSEEALLIRVSNGNDNKRGTVKVDFALFKYNLDGTLKSASAEIGRRHTPTEDRLVQDVRLEYLAVEFNGEAANFRHTTQTTNADYFNPPTQAQ